MRNDETPYREAEQLTRSLTGAQFGAVMQELKALYGAPGTTNQEIRAYVLNMAASPTTGPRVVKDIKSAIRNFNQAHGG